MPLQHVNDRILTQMRRQISRQETQELIQAAREIVPNIALRTTFLVGFPSETQDEFQELVDFVNLNKFERVGVFQYSHEENTRAYDLVDNISAKVKQRRANILMETQQEISFQLNQQKIGKTVKAIFDRKEGGYFVGRSEYDSPEVDNEILVKADRNFARIGDFANVLITDATDYDLFGDIVTQ